MSQLASLIGFLVIFSMFAVVFGVAALTVLMPACGAVALFSQQRRAWAVRMLKKLALAWTICLAGVVVLVSFATSP